MSEHATATQIDDMERILRAGLAEAANGAREEFEPFIRDFGPVIATTAVRAAAGDNAARVALDQLRQQVKTHAYIAQVRAAGVSDQTIQLIIGTAIRLALGAI